MELVLLELLLWGGLLFFFWAMKDGLGNVESDLEALGVLNKSRGQRRGRVLFQTPERVAEQIGNYADTPIYRYAVFQNRFYQFDRVCPAGTKMEIDLDELCIAPGLVYRECAEQPQFANQN